MAVLGVAAAWDDLPSYDEENVPDFLAQAIAAVHAAQRFAVSLTEAFLAAVTGRAPIGIDPDVVIDNVRPGVNPEEVYHRPFVDVWGALKDHQPWQDAVAKGRDRALSTADMDVQLAHRETLRQVGEQDDLILGYARVNDANACDFCRLVSGQRYRTDQLMPVHNRCGCSVDVITAENRDQFSGKRENDLSVDGAAVHEHGELGPVLTDPDHHFTTEAQALH